VPNDEIANRTFGNAQLDSTILLQVCRLFFLSSGMSSSIDLQRLRFPLLGATSPFICPGLRLMVGTNELVVNIYFAWKPDSLQLADVVSDEEEEPQPVMMQSKRARWEDCDCEGVPEVSAEAETSCGGSNAQTGATGR
jgi:hypothetical protein